MWQASVGTAEAALVTGRPAPGAQQPPLTAHSPITAQHSGNPPPQHTPLHRTVLPGGQHVAPLHKFVFAGQQVVPQQTSVASQQLPSQDLPQQIPSRQTSPVAQTAQSPPVPQACAVLPGWQRLSRQQPGHSF